MKAMTILATLMMLLPTIYRGRNVTTLEEVTIGLQADSVSIDGRSYPRDSVKVFTYKRNSFVTADKQTYIIDYQRDTIIINH